MSRSKHTEAQMIAAVKQLEAGLKAEDVAREVGVSTHTIYAWKSKYGGMDVSEAQEAKRLRDENGRLRKLVADLSLDKEALQSVIENLLVFTSATSVHLTKPTYEPQLQDDFALHEAQTDMRTKQRSRLGS
jgi:putative transposase